MNKRSLLLTGLGALVLLVLLAGLWAASTWRNAHAGEAARDLVSGNGRIEAIEIDIATKQPGRVAEILVDEGDMVQGGQVVARMDLLSLQAQRNEAAAREQQARDAVAGAEAQLAMRRSDEAAAAALEAARAQREAARAAVDAAAAQLVGARSAVTAALATTARIDPDLRDGILTAPRAGRIQYRVAQPGEVLGSGGKVLNLIDLTDVFMTFFVPETAAGRIALGTEVRLQLDAAPGFVVPARVSYVASAAQFTPKSVETASERQKLMFRVKAQLDPGILKRYADQVKAGVPGVAWVRLDPRRPWPPTLALRNTP